MRSQDLRAFKLLHKNGLGYLQAPLPGPYGNIDHGFSTRIGGCSQGVYSSLNTAYHTGDEVEAALENRRRFFSAFAYDYRELVSTIQVHGSDIAVFNGCRRGEGALPGTAVQRCDALVTTEPGLVLAAYAADCQLIYFYSLQENPVIALVHSGREGALGAIGAKVARYLQQRYRVDPNHLSAALGPAICGRCYLVDDSIAARFRQAGWGKTPYLQPAGDGYRQLDLSAINREQLLDAGIRAHNLVENSWCTSCRPDLFYSYRRDRGVTGRMIGFIAIRRARGGGFH